MQKYQDKIRSYSNVNSNVFIIKKSQRSTLYIWYIVYTFSNKMNPCVTTAQVKTQPITSTPESRGPNCIHSNHSLLIPHQTDDFADFNYTIIPLIQFMIQPSMQVNLNNIIQFCLRFGPYINRLISILIFLYSRLLEQPHCHWGGDGQKGVTDQPFIFEAFCHSILCFFGFVKPLLRVLVIG